MMAGEWWREELAETIHDMRHDEACGPHAQDRREAELILVSPAMHRLLADVRAEELRKAGQDYLAEHAGSGHRRPVDVRRWLFARATEAREETTDGAE